VKTHADRTRDIILERWCFPTVDPTSPVGAKGPRPIRRRWRGACKRTRAGGPVLRVHTDEDRARPSFSAQGRAAILEIIVRLFTIGSASSACRASRSEQVAYREAREKATGPS